MRKDIDIIYFSLFPWDHPYSSVSFSISKEFIKNNRVFYINPPYSYRDFATRYGEKITQERMSDLIMHRLRYEHPPQLENTLYKDNFLAALPPMVPPVNFLGKGEIYNLVRTRNNRIVLNTIKKVIKDNNIKDYIFMNCYNPFYAGFLPKNEFNPLLNIYQCIDDISQNAYTAKHGFDLERNAIQNSERSKGERILGTDPKTGKEVSVKIGRYGPLAQLGEATTEEEGEKPQFASLRPNQSINSITLEEALELFKLPRTLGIFEEEEVSVNIGRFGPYAAHSKKLMLRFLLLLFAFSIANSKDIAAHNL